MTGATATDFKGSEPWACGDCECTARMEKKLSTQGDAFLESLATSNQR
jgi:hypothetical protein